MILTIVANAQKAVVNVQRSVEIWLVNNYLAVSVFQLISFSLLADSQIVDMFIWKPLVNNPTLPNQVVLSNEMRHLLKTCN